MDDDIALLRHLAARPTGLSKRPLDKVVSSDSLYKICQATREWREFARVVLPVSPSTEDVSPFVIAPSLETVRLFMRWLLLTRKGHFGKLSTHTLKTKWYAIMKTVQHESGYTYTSEENQDMKKYIERELVHNYDANTKCREKPLADIEVTKDLLYFLWACDEYCFKHPRVRVQLAFAILILVFTGLRPGEFVESSAWRGSNEGLKYKDVILQALPCTNGEVRFVLEIKLRNRKNHRENEANSPSIFLIEEPANPFLCPVTHFCALAFADSAFVRVDSPARLESTRIRAQIQGKTIIQMKPEIQDVPILRSLTQAGQISEANILSVDSLGALLIGLGHRAGYKNALTAYCFRRGFGNALLNAVTAVQRRQRMGHKSDDTFMHYISNRSGIDSQSIVLKRPQMTGVIEAMCSMRLDVNHAAPVPHGSLLTHAKRQYGADDMIEELKENDPLQVPHMTLRQHFEARRRARRIDFQKVKIRFYENLSEFDEDDQDHSSDSVYSAELYSENAPNDLHALTVTRPGPSRYLQAVLRYEPSRQKLVNLLETEKLLTSMDSSCAHPQISLSERIQPFADLANPMPRPIHYPDAIENANGNCCICYRTLPETKMKKNRHLLACLLKRRKEEACDNVYAWWEAASLPNCHWTSCTQSFQTSKAFGVAKHVSGHLSRSALLECHWDRCKQAFPSFDDLSLHMWSDHGFYCQETVPTTPKYCYECRVIYSSRLEWDRHCRHHLDHKISLFCGLIIQFGIVVIAGICPFCLSDTSLSPTIRAYQWSDCTNLHRHLSDHISTGLEWPIICPHPQCDDCIEDESTFWYHMNAVHGIEPRTTSGRKRKVLDDDDS